MGKEMIKKIFKYFLRKIYKVAKSVIDQEHRENIKKIENKALAFKLTLDPTSFVDFGKIHNQFNILCNNNYFNN